LVKHACKRTKTLAATRGRSDISRGDDVWDDQPAKGAGTCEVQQINGQLGWCGKLWVRPKRTGSRGRGALIAHVVGGVWKDGQRERVVGRGGEDWKKKHIGTSGCMAESKGTLLPFTRHKPKTVMCFTPARGVPLD